MTQDPRQLASMHRVGIDAPMRDVAGKVAFITGGDSGIGLGIVRACANAGMRIALTYRTQIHLDKAMKDLEDAKGRVHAIRLDVTDRPAVAAAAEEVVRIFGKVHVLVSNAGVAPLIPLSNATLDDFDWCMNVNIGGVFNTIHAFLPHIRSHGEGGQIVATSSIVGGVIVGPFWGVYSTSKFAVVGMMEALRSELAQTNIGVSVFCPSAVASNIGTGDRNRPSTFAERGAPDPAQQVAIDKYRDAVARIMQEHPESQLAMDALEAGERVVHGIRNNDLYIFSHSEYEQVLRDRNEALLAALPENRLTPPNARLAFAQLLRNPIYAAQVNAKTTT